MKPNYTELASAYERGEITFDEFMTTATAPERYTVPQTKRRGRRLAQRAGAMLTPVVPETQAHEPLAEAPAPQQQPLATPEEGPYVAAPGNLKTAEAALAFIMAGNAYFTVRSLKTGTRYTYRVSRAKDNPTDRAYYGRTGPTYFVALLTGPENTGDYSYLGMIRDNVFRLTRASKMNEISIPVRAFRWVYERLVRRELPPQTEIWHEGRCGRCGRMLTVPSSIEAGIGPECAGKVGL